MKTFMFAVVEKITRDMKTKYLAFATQKGGAGKTTFNSLLANYIYHNVTEKVAVIDGDDFQRSLTDVRSFEVTEENKDSLYPIFAVNSSKIMEFCDQNLEGEFEYVIIDLPGNLKQKGVIDIYINFDFIFIPTNLSQLDVDSTVRFFNLLISDIIPQRVKLGFPEPVVRGMLNNIGKSTLEYKDYERLGSSIIHKDLKFFESVMPHSIPTFQRNISTTETYTHDSHPELIEDLCKEIMDLIK